MILNSIRPPDGRRQLAPRLVRAISAPLRSWSRHIITFHLPIARRPGLEGGSLEVAFSPHFQIRGTFVALPRRQNYANHEIKPPWDGNLNGSLQDGVKPAAAMPVNPPPQPRHGATGINDFLQPEDWDTMSSSGASSRPPKLVRQDGKPGTAQDEVIRGELKVTGANIERLFPQGKLKRSEWKDEDWARIYATRFLSLSAVIRCLKLFGVQKIGPVSMREVLVRCNDGEVLDVARLREHLVALEEAEICHDDSAFCRLVYKLSRDGNSPILYDMATSDMHPGEYDHINLQESLLALCDERRDATRSERLWQTLLLGVPVEAQEARRLNLLLRKALSRNDEIEVDTVVQLMQDSRVQVEWRSLSWMYQKILPERLVGGAPPSSQIRRLIRLWTRFMNYGCNIPARNWGDILRSLLIQGDLDGHEELCLKLLDWYTNSFRAAHPETQHQFDALFQGAHLKNTLFYSFHYGRFSTDSPLHLSANQTREERAALLASHPVFRGLRLLLHLRRLGCNVDIREIQAILRKNIWRMCHGSMVLESGALVERVTSANERDYHRAAEVLIGERDRLRNSMDARHRRRRKLAHLSRRGGDRPFETKVDR